MRGEAGRASKKSGRCLPPPPALARGNDWQGGSGSVGAGGTPTWNRRCIADRSASGPHSEAR
eukprot:3006457-Pyramimonas_sp.AAC.1